MAAALEVTRHEPQARGLGRRSGGLLGDFLRAGVGRLIPDARTRRGSLAVVRLAAAVVVIVLGAMMAMSFREDSLDMPARAPMAPPVALATELFEVTLDSEAIPEQLAGILVFRKVYPTDLDISYGDGFVPANTFVRYVEEGELGIRPRSEVRAIRAGSSWTEAEVVAAGQEAVIGPGDTFAMQDVPWSEYGTEALGEMWTPGEDARVVGFAIRETARCCSMTHPGMESP